MKRFQVLISRAALFLIMVSALGSNLARAEIIYQAFDERMRPLIDKLDDLAAAGFSAVQISPPQKSVDLDIWWARYQPIDFRVIEGPLGNEQDLKDLIHAAHRRGLKLIVDVVLNHMADKRYVGGELSYPEFSANDFHYSEGRHCMSDFRNRHQVTHYWLCDANAHLPDLDTSSAYVRGVHKRYLKKLLDLGVDGFRIDATKHIEPEYFGDVRASIPQGKFVYGEVIGETLEESRLYTGYMPVTDFHLLRTLLSVFSLNGDMRWLIHPEGVGGALPGNVAVAFARNHDTAMHSDFFNFGDRTDALLANAYVLGRGYSDASVYRDDAYDDTTRAALKFRRALHGEPTYVRDSGEVCYSECTPRDLLVMERGTRGVMLINKADGWLDVSRAEMPGLAEGCYVDLRHGARMEVSRGGDGKKWISAWGTRARGGFAIGPRSALMLVKTGNCP